MKIGFISDTHGCADRWALACEKFFQGADYIVHSGDVLYHGPRNPMKADYNPALLAERINAAPCPVLICRGNCDSEVDQLVLQTPIEAPFLHLYADGLRVVATHGHKCMHNDEKDALAKTLQADIFVSGHIHQTVLEKRGQTIFLNPGSPSLSKRADGRQTVAVLDAGKITVYDVDSGEALQSLAL